jgi:membrane-associated phospholipid phosphatase
MKMLFGRYRPDLWISQNLYGFDFLSQTDLKMSFPSGHSAVIASILFSIACVYPKKFLSLAILTFVLSFCRVVVEKHYISDILASMLLALFVAQGIYISLKKVKVIA